ncbi:MAG: hypothetical protein MZV49_09395 [Rhodopseudomonas palustris]|nr:hypothetical protein [Rhodopseudomonas palustris]
MPPRLAQRGPGVHPACGIPNLPRLAPQLHAACASSTARLGPDGCSAPSTTCGSTPHGRPLRRRLQGDREGPDEERDLDADWQDALRAPGRVLPVAAARQGTAW